MPAGGDPHGAVWGDDVGRLHVLPPCGRCREFIRQVDPENLNTQVILGREETAALAALLPRDDWPEPLD
jgi:cytidine deaminase